MMILSHKYFTTEWVDGAYGVSLQGNGEILLWQTRSQSFWRDANMLLFNILYIQIRSFVKVEFRWTKAQSLLESEIQNTETNLNLHMLDNI